MENVLFEVAKQSPVAIVAIIAIWRISVVLIAQSEGLVKIALMAGEDIGEIAQKGQNLPKKEE